MDGNYSQTTAETLRSAPRGFAVKFYTQEGNFDMVGNNMPVFFIRDGMKVRVISKSIQWRADDYRGYFVFIALTSIHPFNDCSLLIRCPK